MLTGFIVTADSDQKDELDGQWKIVFIISASVYLVGCIIYWFFASGELQPWAVLRKTEADDMEFDRQQKRSGDIGGYENKSMEYEDGE